MSVVNGDPTDTASTRRLRASGYRFTTDSDSEIAGISIGSAAK